MPDILFVPFSERENNYRLYYRSLKWCDNLKLANKLEKIPQIILYPNPSETQKGHHENSTSQQLRFNNQNILPGTCLYILADGIGNSHFVSNLSYKDVLLKEDAYVLSIEIIAARLKSIGLSPELAKRLKAIHLFICDEYKVNNLLAYNFAQALGKEYASVPICYYTSLIAAPSAANWRKKALLETTEGYVYTDIANVKRFLFFHPQQHSQSNPEEFSSPTQKIKKV